MAHNFMKSRSHDGLAAKGLLVCGFEVCLGILNFIVIGRYTINVPETFSGFHGFLSLTVNFLGFALCLIVLSGCGRDLRVAETCSPAQGAHPLASAVVVIN